MPKVKIHPTADVQSEKIGAGSTIWQYCVVLPRAEIGANCNINALCFIENDVQIGDNVTVKSGVYIWDGVCIENNVFIGPNVSFTNDLYPRSKRRPERFLPTAIKEGASIGAGSVILAGIVIGRYAMIGAGSVVAKSVPDFTLWHGSPARFVSYICRCGKKLDSDYICPDCGTEYRLNNNILIEKHEFK